MYLTVLSVALVQFLAVAELFPSLFHPATLL